MKSLEELMNDKLVREEYKRAVLMGMFKKIVIKGKKDNAYKEHIEKLFKQSYDKVNTTKLIMKNELNCELTDDEAVLVCEWFMANRAKKPRRQAIPKWVKEDLCRKQNNLCISCGENLGTDLSKIHVDHIVPWFLVGDELKDNFQALCDTCNECKSSKTDYIIGKLLNLI